MRLAPSEHRAYTYKVTVAPINPAVSLALFKQHINVVHTLTDEILQIYLDAATQFAERYTGRDLITRTYSTFRDFFPNAYQNEGYYTYGNIPEGVSGSIGSPGGVGFEIRKSPLQAVESITYINASGVSTVVDPLVYIATLESDYSEIVTLTDMDWPHDSANRMQSIDISFRCGMADSDAGIESCWKLAIMEHAAMLWANRGDCSDVGCMKMIPAAAKAFYDLKRIRNL